MSTLLEIEKAAEMLPTDQQRELFGFLLKKYRNHLNVFLLYYDKFYYPILS
jgi:hypothetical protein